MKSLLIIVACFCLKLEIVFGSLRIGLQCSENKLGYVRNCTLPTGRNGVCAQICKVPDNKDADICCHIKAPYFLKVYHCCEQEVNEWGHFAVVGGVKTVPDEFPYMVAIGWYSKEKLFQYDYKCGGVLISPKFVLTAAHCAYVDGVEANMVLAGGVNLLHNSKRHYTIERVFIHPDYDEELVYNDIALLQLVSNYSGQTIDIWQRDYIADSNFTALGYGDTKFGGTSSDDLLKVFLQHIPNDDCQSYFELDDNMPNGIINTQLCAKDSKTIMDTCQGDSGGPLIMTVRNNYGNKKEYLVGITSFGQGCALSPPGVYTKVASFIDWISDILRPWRVTNRNFNNSNVWT